MLWTGTAAAGLLEVPRPTAGEVRLAGIDALQRWSLVAAFPQASTAPGPDDPIAGVLAGDWDRLAFAGRLGLHARAEGSQRQSFDDVLARRERASGFSGGIDYSRGATSLWARWTARTDDRREELRDAASGERHLATLDRSAASRTSAGMRRHVALPFGGDFAARLEQATVAGTGGRQDITTTALRWSQPLGGGLSATAGWTRGEAGDAPLVVRDPRTGLALPLLAAALAGTQAQAGFSWRAPSGIDVMAAAFRATAARDLAFSGEGGWQLRARPVQRDGVQLDLRAPAWGVADLDVRATLLRARFADGEREAVPGAAQAFGTAGATLRSLPAGWSARLSVSYLGPRDAIAEEAPRIRSTTRVNAQVQRKLARNTRLILDVFNVFDHRITEVDEFSAARSGLQPGAGETFLLRPTESRTVVLRLRTTF